MQVKTVIPIRIGNLIVNLVGVADGIRGATVYDWKCTKPSGFNAEKYARSYQWRAYLEMFACQTFQYDVFEAVLSTFGETILVGAKKTLRFYRYNGMERDLRNELRDWVDVLLSLRTLRVDQAHEPRH